MKKKGVSRFSVSISSELLNEFDQTIRKMGYEDRSKAVHVAMRNFITEYRWIREERGLSVGAVVMLYDHQTRGLEAALTSIQHGYEKIISSSMHVHLDEHNCLEIIAVKGETKAVRGLSQRLMTERGVKQLKLTVITP